MLHLRVTVPIRRGLLGIFDNQGHNIRGADFDAFAVEVAIVELAKIDQRLSGIPGLFTSGSGFRAIGIPDCITDGRETAALAAAFVR